MADKHAPATALIVALAKKKVSESNPAKDDDLETCAKGILAAVKSGSAKDLASALRSLREVENSGD
jgi:hypothetical protein